MLTSAGLFSYSVYSHIAAVDRLPFYEHRNAQVEKADDTFFSFSTFIESTLLLSALTFLIVNIFGENGIRNMCCHVSPDLNTYNADNAAAWMREIWETAEDFNIPGVPVYFVFIYWSSKPTCINNCVGKMMTVAMQKFLVFIQPDGGEHQ